MTRTKRVVLGLSGFGVLVLFLNMFGNRPSFQADPLLTRPSFTADPLLPRDDERQEWESIHFQIQTRDATVPAEGYDSQRDAILWGTPTKPLEPCWSSQLEKRSKKPWGFVVVTCSNGPHNHRVQIADAVVVALELGASLVLPRVKEAQKEPNSQFEDIYNVKQFVSSLEGTVRVIGQLPIEKRVNMSVISTPLKVSRSYIEEHIRPVFNEHYVVFLGSFLSPIKGETGDPALNAVRCLVMYKALQFLPFIQKLGDRLVSRMREAAPVSARRQFVAVDLQLDLLHHKTCNSTKFNKKRCLEPLEVGHMLREMGYPPDTAVYLTQSRWESNLEPLAQLYPNIHTKEYSMPFNEENQFLYSGKTLFEAALDFYICARSDVFVPTVLGLFYNHVTGERIARGSTLTIVPAMGNSSRLYGVVSPYVVKKNHPAHQCFCEQSANVTAGIVEIVSNISRDGRPFGKEKHGNELE